jgi:hypothetical protein
LITDAEKADAIANKFTDSHNNNMSSPLSNMVRANCSVLRGGGFNIDAAIYTSPREFKGFVKKLRNGKAPGGHAINNFLLKHLSFWYI